jgi:hypothetical protein
LKDLELAILGPLLLAQLHVLNLHHKSAVREAWAGQLLESGSQPGSVQSIRSTVDGIQCCVIFPSLRKSACIGKSFVRLQMSVNRLFDRSQTLFTVRALSKPVSGSEVFTAFKKTNNNQRVNSAVVLMDVVPVIVQLLAKFEHGITGLRVVQSFTTDK